MSERLKQGLQASKTEIEAGLAEAERELARARQRCRELEELIALGRATLLAAQMSAARGGAVGPATTEVAPASTESTEDLAARLDKAAELGKTAEK